MIPSKQLFDQNGQVTMDYYRIEMIKTTKQFLPTGIFPETTIYAYAGNTQNGYHATFPGPAIFAT
jgi:hypothetical protein